MNKRYPIAVIANFRKEYEGFLDYFRYTGRDNFTFVRVGRLSHCPHPISKEKSL
jgi:hypothetical protein